MKGKTQGGIRKSLIRVGKLKTKTKFTVMKKLIVLSAFVISLFSMSGMNAQELTKLVKYDKEKSNYLAQ